MNMFKRYKAPFEDSTEGNLFEKDNLSSTSAQLAQRHTNPYAEEQQQPSSLTPKPNSEAPPRIFNNRQPPPSLKEQGELSQETLDALGEDSTWSSSTSSQNNYALQTETPETTLGEGVTFKGELSFNRLLLIDGNFEGELTSATGKLIVGPKGVVKSQNIQLREAVIEGEIQGNITVKERIEIRGRAKIRGNIEAQSISVDEGVSIVGHIEVASGGDE